MVLPQDKKPTLNSKSRYVFAVAAKVGFLVTFGASLALQANSTFVERRQLHFGGDFLVEHRFANSVIDCFFPYEPHVASANGGTVIESAGNTAYPMEHLISTSRPTDVQATELWIAGWIEWDSVYNRTCADAQDINRLDRSYVETPTTNQVLFNGHGRFKKGTSVGNDLMPGAMPEAPYGILPFDDDYQRTGRTRSKTRGNTETLPVEDQIALTLLNPATPVQQSNASISVPEPSSWFFFLPVFILLVTRRRARIA